MKAATCLEDVRHSYKPGDIRVLFVGESPPSGGTFFYKADSNLSRYTQQAFSVTFNTAFESGEDFLRCFQELGCYLDDLCLFPVNRTVAAERNCHRARGVEALAVRMRVASPNAIIVVMRAIRRYVKQARCHAGLESVPVHFVSFPAQGHQQRYVAELVGLLRQLQETGVLASE